MAVSESREERPKRLAAEVIDPCGGDSVEAVILIAHTGSSKNAGGRRYSPQGGGGEGELSSAQRSPICTHQNSLGAEENVKCTAGDAS